MYKRQLTWFPEKKISVNPSLLKSAVPTPPPAYTYSLTKGFTESDSSILLLKSIPVALEEISLNSVPFEGWLQAAIRKTSHPPKKNLLIFISDPQVAVSNPDFDLTGLLIM